FVDEVEQVLPVLRGRPEPPLVILRRETGETHHVVGDGQHGRVVGARLVGRDPGTEHPAGPRTVFEKGDRMVFVQQLFRRDQARRTRADHADVLSHANLDLSSDTVVRMTAFRRGRPAGWGRTFRWCLPRFRARVSVRFRLTWTLVAESASRHGKAGRRCCAGWAESDCRDAGCAVEYQGCRRCGWFD